MFSAWTKHLTTNEEKEKFQQGLRGSRWILDRQKELLKELEETLDRNELSPTVYAIPNWDYRQADINGYRRCLKAIQKLIDLDQKDK